MARITHIRNHDGELVPFRRARIVRAILAAVRQAGSSEEWVAEALTDTVVYFLDQRHAESKEPPSAFDLDDVIETVLTAQPDLARVARAFMDSRRQRAQIRELEESIRQTHGPEVSQPARGLETWNRARIAAALVRENGLPPREANEIAEAVERRVQAFKLPRLSTGLIRELVDVELLSRGLMEDGRPGSVAVPRYDLDQWLFPRDDQEPAGTQLEFSERASRRVLTEYTLTGVHDARVREGHETGRLHLEALDAPAALSEVRLDAAALLAPGAGLGLQRHFAEATQSLAAGFSRLARVVREVSTITRHLVVLEDLDRALAPLIVPETPQRARLALQEGMALLAYNGAPRLRITLGAPRGDAADFATLAFLDALCGEDSGMRSRVEIFVGVSAAALEDRTALRLLERAASAASFCGQPLFSLRDSARAGERGMFGDLGDGRLHRSILARAGLNLVTTALEVAQGDMAAFLALLEDRVQLAVDALVQRARFVERVAKRDLPQPVGLGARMARSLVLASRELCLVPVGLQQAACLVSGASSASSPAAQRAAQQVLSYLAFKSAEVAARAGMKCLLGGRLAEDCAVRLYHEDRTRLGGNSRLPTSAEGYLAGTQTAEPMSFERRLSCESSLHSLTLVDARLVCGTGERATQAKVLVWLRQCLAEPSHCPAALEIAVASRICRDCGNISPAELTACPACGSQAWAVPPGQRFLFDASAELP